MDFGRTTSRVALSRARSRLSTPLVNAETAENILKNTIFKNWKNIQRQCRNQDAQNTGTINVEQLRGKKSVRLYTEIISVYNDAVRVIEMVFL